MRPGWTFPPERQRLLGLRSEVPLLMDGGRMTACGVVALTLLAVLPAAAADPGLEVMQKQRDLHRVRDEEETQTLRLVNKAGAVKERKLVRWVFRGAGDLEKILVRFTAPRDVENTGLLVWEAKDGNDDQWLYLP